MQGVLDFFNSLGSVGTALAAVGILVLGYVVARIVAGIVRRLLANKTSLDNRLAKAISESTGIKEFNVEQLIANIVFWVVLLFFVVAFLNKLNLPSAANPLTAFLQNVTTTYLPNLIGAIVLLGVAWLIASVLRFLITKGATALKIDERLTPTWCFGRRRTSFYQ